MNDIIISIGCEYGSGGPAIGKILADDLELKYYDRALIDKIMEETGISQKVISTVEEGKDVKGRSHELNNTSAPSKYAVLTDRMVYIQSQIIKKLASRGPCVFIGRCSDYVLKDDPNCVNVFIYAPDEVRVKNVSEALHIDAEQARKRIAEEDKILHARYKQMTGTYRGDRHNRHLLIDSSYLGLEGTAKLIESFISKKLAE